MTQRQNSEICRWSPLIDEYKYLKKYPGPWKDLPKGLKVSEAHTCQTGKPHNSWGIERVVVESCLN
jgi:hypothetical protein